MTGRVIEGPLGAGWRKVQINMEGVGIMYEWTWPKTN